MLYFVLAIAIIALYHITGSFISDSNTPSVQPLIWELLFSTQKEGPRGIREKKLQRKDSNIREKATFLSASLTLNDSIEVLSFNW